MAALRGEPAARSGRCSSSRSTATRSPGSFSADRRRTETGRTASAASSRRGRPAALAPAWPCPRAARSRAAPAARPRGDKAYLGVDGENPNRAMTLYESCGFRIGSSSTTWLKATRDRRPSKMTTTTDTPASLPDAPAIPGAPVPACSGDAADYASMARVGRAANLARRGRRGSPTAAALQIDYENTTDLVPSRDLVLVEVRRHGRRLRVRLPPGPRRPGRLPDCRAGPSRLAPPGIGRALLACERGAHPRSSPPGSRIPKVGPSGRGATTPRAARGRCSCPRATPRSATASRCVRPNLDDIPDAPAPGRPRDPPGPAGAPSRDLGRRTPRPSATTGATASRPRRTSGRCSSPTSTPRCGRSPGTATRSPASVQTMVWQRGERGPRRQAWLAGAHLRPPAVAAARRSRGRSSPTRCAGCGRSGWRTRCSASIRRTPPAPCSLYESLGLRRRRTRGATYRKPLASRRGRLC